MCLTPRTGAPKLRRAVAFVQLRLVPSGQWTKLLADASGRCRRRGVTLQKSKEDTAAINLAMASNLIDKPLQQCKL